MTSMDAVPPAPQKDYGRAGRNLPAAVGSAVVLLVAIGGSLVFFKAAFMLIVAAAVVVAVWELHRGLAARAIDIPEQPLMAGGVVMVAVAYFWGPSALVTATAVTALVVMLWLLRRGVDGFVQNASAAVFTLVYVPFLGSFVALMLAEGGDLLEANRFDDGVRGIVTFLRTTDEELRRDPQEGPSPSSLKQNQMMWRRIQFQALAVIAAVLLLLLAHPHA